MNIDELTLGQIKQLQSLLGGAQSAPVSGPDPDQGKFVLVRTYSAGVHFGLLASRNGREVRLLDAQRIWSWTGANTLSEISLRGVGADSKISEQVESITLTEAIEVIPCTDAARNNLRGIKWMK